jgi:hypothetical protein
MRPGRVWYGVAVVVVFVGVGGASYLLFARLGELQDAFTRLVVPGNIDLALDKPGVYTIFHEASSVIDGRLYVADNISGLAVTVTSLEGGEALALRPPVGQQTYSMNGHSGTAVLVFTVVKPGHYRLAAAYDNGRAETRTVLAVARDFVGTLIDSILRTLGLGFGSAALAVAIFLATFFLRRRADRLARGT